MTPPILKPCCTLNGREFELDVQEAAGKLRQQLQTTASSLDARKKAVDECEARIRRLTAEVAALTREVTAKDAEILALQHRCDMCQASSQTQLLRTGALAASLQVAPCKLGWAWLAQLLMLSMQEGCVVQ